MAWTTTQLLANIRRRGALPTATATGTADSDLLALADEETQSWLVPLMLSLREDYLLHRYSVATVAGTTEYRIPHRAMGGKLREVEIVEADSSIRNLVRIGVDELSEWSQSENAEPEGFYFRGPIVALVPTPNIAETLRMTFFMRPNALTNTAANYKAITAIGGGGSPGNLAFGTAHGWTTSTKLDFVKATSPFDVLAYDQTADSANANDITFASIPDDLAVGDYVCAAETTPVPNFPADFHHLLAQRVACKVLEALGLDRHAIAARRLDEMEASLRETFRPRIDGEQGIAAANQYGLMGDSGFPWADGW